MARHPNPNNKFTTISIRKEDKAMLRMLARKIKETKNGTVYEKDADIFGRTLHDYMIQHKEEVSSMPRPTYPSSVLMNTLSKSRQDSSL